MAESAYMYADSASSSARAQQEEKEEGVTRPTLRTERLVLEPLTVVHTEQLVELDADPEVLRFIFGRGLTRAEVVDTWMPKRTRADADARGIGYWVGHDAGGTFLGWWSLAVVDDDPDSAELGYRLRRDAWGHGYATEGARALLAHAFETVGLRRVCAETMAVNAGSRAVLEKLGLSHVGTRVEQWDDPLPDAALGEVDYEIDAAAYRAPRQS
ncbi:GNAT family N-acetyltransferase [Nocardioides sp.]|uniref:GNAT family N-acetyltransferase n=1 Tax=Nocardioides sp. TaxID=35761 RepID=UPI002723A6C7|nr:GNAT family N-acetyltransferase [Nocardioides sp.]MDO9456299.1 GNAT family N-acetyltransferase [Nocardioides sp.]